MAAARHGGHAHAELIARPSRGLAKVAEADHDASLAADRNREDGRPSPLALLIGQRRKARRKREQRHEAELFAFRPMRSAVVGERDVARQPIQRQKMIDSGARGLDPAQLGRAAAQAVPRRPRGDHRTRGTQCAVDDVAVVPDGHVDLTGDLGMTLDRAMDILLGDTSQGGAARTVLDMEMKRHAWSRMALIVAFCGCVRCQRTSGQTGMTNSMSIMSESVTAIRLRNLARVSSRMISSRYRPTLNTTIAPSGTETRITA